MCCLLNGYVYIIHVYMYVCMYIENLPITAVCTSCVLYVCNVTVSVSVMFVCTSEQSCVHVHV